MRKGGTGLNSREALKKATKYFGIDTRPPPIGTSRWEISDAVLAGYAPAGRCLFFTDADFSATSVQSLVRIVVYLKNISKRIPLN